MTERERAMDRVRVRRYREKHRGEINAKRNARRLLDAEWKKRQDERLPIAERRALWRKCRRSYLDKNRERLNAEERARRAADPDYRRKRTAPERKREIRLAALEAYGGLVCSCCGESCERF